ncbi:MAG: protein translocase subunit SecD [Patescibacteria group bacterium]|jgi:protein-export membrane protein SecD
MSDNIFQKLIKSSPRGRLWQIFTLVIVLTIAAALIDVGSVYNKGTAWLSGKTSGYVQLPKVGEVPFHLGLDLQGGTHLVYKADTSNVPAGGEADAAEGVRDVIERRVNAFGVAEPLIQINKAGEDDYRIIVELAGVKDADEAIKMIGETPILEFKEQGDRSLNDEETQKLINDNTKAEAKAEEALGKILSRGDFAKIAGEYDESGSFAVDGKWIDLENSPDIADAVSKLKIDGVTDLVESSDGYYIDKLLEKKSAKNELTGEDKIQVKASHLLICYDGAEGCEGGLSKEDAYAKIKELKEKATAKNFTELVKANSTEPGADQTGGELGWFGKGTMVTPFEDTVFPQKVRTISFVVETKFGYHLIYKEAERKLEQYRVQEIFVAKTTRENLIGGEDSFWVTTNLTGKYLKRASVQFDQNSGRPEVSLKFDGDGAKLLEEITGRNVGKQLAIFLDGKSIIDTNGDEIIDERDVYAPTVNQEISGGEASISGNFNLVEAKTLSRRLNAGALPVPITLSSQQVVGASLGRVSIQNSLQAGLWGLLLVAIFMIAFYRLPGLISVLSLAVYGLFTLAILKVFHVTLTLSGIAGFILSIGMAVDANVLIFERLKEELRSGNAIDKAMKNGFARAWPSIRDGNLSTILTCLILFWFSTSMIKGFALTLAIGILMSLFTAVTITRNLLNLLPEKLFSYSFLVGVNKEKIQ